MRKDFNYQQLPYTLFFGSFSLFRHKLGEFANFMFTYVRTSLDAAHQVYILQFWR